jgi:hypothetical protein
MILKDLKDLPEFLKSFFYNPLNPENQGSDNML